jgi:hypothetical protein
MPALSFSGALFHGTWPLRAFLGRLGAAAGAGKPFVFRSMAGQGQRTQASFDAYFQPGHISFDFDSLCRSFEVRPGIIQIEIEIEIGIEIEKKYPSVT